MDSWTITTPWLTPRCALGEGPFYERASRTVRFVDIINKRFHTASIDDGPATLTTTQFDVAITATADLEGVDPAERILVGCKGGVAILDRKTGKLELISKFESERVRGNDGAADPHGRYWIGTMTDFPYGDVQNEGGQTAHLEKLGIPNSVGFSPDGSTMYFTHTTAGHILAMDYDVVTGAVSNQRVHYAHANVAEGLDGFRVDVQGNIWHAVYGGGCILRLNTKGEVTGRVAVPTRNVTCVEFVGTELVITTAADEEGDEASKENGGAVFRVDVGVEGVEAYKFKLG